MKTTTHCRECMTTVTPKKTQLPNVAGWVENCPHCGFELGKYNVQEHIPNATHDQVKVWAGLVRELLNTK